MVEEDWTSPWCTDFQFRFEDCLSFGLVGRRELFTFGHLIGREYFGKQLVVVLRFQLLHISSCILTRLFNEEGLLIRHKTDDATPCCYSTMVIACSTRLFFYSRINVFDCPSLIIVPVVVFMFFCRDLMLN